MATRESFGRTAELDKYPKINPAIFESAKGLMPNFGDEFYGVKLWILALMVIFLIVMMYFMIQIYQTLETPANIRCKLNTYLDRFEKYGDTRVLRGGLSDYVSKLKAAGVPDSKLLLTNFYISAANSPAIFLPLTDGIASPDAVRLSLAAGARYLDFQIASDTKRHKYRPIIKALDQGSNWRRITMTEMPFKTAMENVMKYGIAGPKATADTNSAPYCHDPLFIMLRFNSPVRDETYAEIADILNKTMEPNRLDFTYNKVRNMAAIFRTPITNFMDKIVIMTNTYPPKDSPLMDYINVGPRSALPLQISSKEIKTMPAQNYPDYIKKIMQNLTISRSELVEPDCDKNINDWQLAQSLGIHFTPMNFWSEDDMLRTYLSTDNFGTYSFKYKPDSLLYTLNYIAPPSLPNPNMDARDGKLIAPPAIVMPS